SLHTNSMDEALALPSEHAVTLALRTQQVIAQETGVTHTVDPLGGSYFLEALTNQTEREVYAYFRKIEEYGGVIPALEAGFFQGEIADASYRDQLEVDKRQRVIVGVNQYADEAAPRIPILRMDPKGYERQIARLQTLRLERDNAAVGQALDALRAACAGNDNVMPYLLDAARSYATLGEIVDVMREVFGIYQERVQI
ncbi:MAG: methylmalonyl-CoA mutase family protein, partial [Chloroflexota bacterium]